jgi:7-cyano-7-deazaguanine synthase
MKKKRKAIVLLSGGLDSTICAVLACNEFGAENVIALSLYYGQKHAKEIKSAEAIQRVCPISFGERGQL